MSEVNDLPCPPLDGSIPVIPGFLDFHAEHSPSKPMWVYPNSHPSSFDYGIITWQEFADATHRISHAIRPGRAGPERAIVAIVANCDTLLYHALTVGTIRAGLVPFPMSPRSSAPDVANMIELTDCHRLITQPAFSSLVDGIRTSLPPGYNLRVDYLPSLSDIFPAFAPPGEIPSSASLHSRFEYLEALSPSDVVLYIHSSGSTGFSKPIAQTGTTILHWCSSQIVTETRKHRLRWGSMALPPFSTMGFVMQLYEALVSGLPVSIFEPRAHLGLPPPLPTPENTIDAARRTNANAIPTVPSFLEAWAHDEEIVKYLATMQIVPFAGGPLSSKNGDKLVRAGVNITAVYGGTEFGALSCMFDTGPDSKRNPSGKTRDEWQWMQFPSDQVKIRWIPQGDGTFELVFMTCPTHQPSKENLENGEKGYATSDLWEPHPTKNGLWRIVGRTDDVIVLSTGQKIVPIYQEGHIGAHRQIAGALMFGRGREQPGILVELHPEHQVPAGDESGLVDLQNAIWQQVEEANKRVPAFAQIAKEAIILADPSRPFPRAAKGTIMRKQTLALYEPDINALYAVMRKARLGLKPGATAAL